MKLTKDQVHALNNIWEQIAPDALEAFGETELSQNEVIELVLDADRPTTFYPEIDWSEFQSLLYSERIQICKQQVFTYEIYG
jgi:hypothetical protein